MRVPLFYLAQNFLKAEVFEIASASNEKAASSKRDEASYNQTVGVPDRTGFNELMRC